MAPETTGSADQDRIPTTAALPTEQVRALVRLLYPDHMTPTAKRLFEAACHEVEDPPDEDMQQGCS